MRRHGKESYAYRVFYHHDKVWTPCYSVIDSHFSGFQDILTNYVSYWQVPDPEVSWPSEEANIKATLSTQQRFSVPKHPQSVCPLKSCNLIKSRTYPYTLNCWIQGHLHHEGKNAKTAFKETLKAHLDHCLPLLFPTSPTSQWTSIRRRTKRKSTFHLSTQNWKTALLQPAQQNILHLNKENLWQRLPVRPE